MFDVLVTGAETHQGIIVIRSLGRRGVKMLVTGDCSHSIGFYSRYISGRALLPSAESEKTAFVDGLLDLIAKYKIPYIYPVTETSLIALDERRTEVEEAAKLLAASSQTIRCGVDKKLTLEIAEQQGVPTTKTLYPKSIEEAEEFAAKWGYPVIVKPRGRSNDSRIGGKFNFKVLYAHNRDQLREIMSPYTDAIYPMMQEYAYGPHAQFSCFMEKGEAHSLFLDDMVRMLPITGGIGARRKSREMVPEIAEQSIRLFKAMEWEGCGQTQWKGPGKDGKFRFIEVSVRIIASVGSPVFSGVDLPWMQYQYFTGQPVDRANGYKIGKSSRWFRGDVITVTRYLIGDTPKSADRLPSKPQVLLSWLGDFVRPGLKNDVESLTDPIPGFLEFILLVRDIMLIVKRKIVQRYPILSAIRRRFKSMEV